MSAKKKKPSISPLTKEGDQGGVMDIFGYIDLIEKCRKKAESDESACLDGIKKSDRVLGQTTEDPDIQCIVLIKRAELFYTAVKNKYETEELYRQPLESCIEDCEMVLSKVSSANGTGRGLITTAKALLENAQKLKKTLQREARAKRLKHASGERAPKPVVHRYDPTKTVFKDAHKINPHLIHDIVQCFQDAKRACRFCYYKLNRPEEVSSNRFCKKCKKSVPPFILIPASKMCRNLTGSAVVGISSPPKMLLAKANKHKPFLMCKNKDHNVCIEKAAVGVVWFAHSIEELVIWTIERYYNCSFEEYIQSEYKGPEISKQATSSSSKGGASQLRQEDYYDEDEFDYYPEDCVFKNTEAIPQVLLLDVIELFGQAKDHCRWCFYIRSKNGFAKFDKSFNMNVCSVCHNEWESVVVIPASKMCWNFGNFDFIPVAPLPVGKLASAPFEYCQKPDHYRCFKVFTDSTFWYPHSVEEMIIWTVERDKKCKFSEFIDKISRIPESLDTSPKGHTSAPPSKITVNNIPSTAVPSKAIPVKPVSISHAAINPPMTKVGPVKQEFQYASLSTKQAKPAQATAVPMVPGLPRRVDPIGTHPLTKLPASVYQLKPPISVTTVPMTTNPLGMLSASTMNGSYNGIDSNKHLGNLTQLVQASQTPLTVNKPTSSAHTNTSSPHAIYKLGEVSFKTVAEIPQDLLKGISACFSSKREVCRICFYEERVLSDIVQATNTCDSGNHQWSKPLLVIDGCSLCDNEPCYGREDTVPIPPLPPVATIKKCPQTNHHKCYSKALKANEMFAHSVEALVVWIVESEQECLFQEYTSQKLGSKGSEPIKNTVQKPATTSNGVFAVSQPPTVRRPPLISTTPTFIPPETTKLYDPKIIEFTTIDDIAPELLSAVAECFKSCTHVCRVCFFESNFKSLIQKVEINRVGVCPSGNHNPWREVRVIPKCKMCINPHDWIPVPPLPRHMMQKPKNPFLMCKKTDHGSCYTMSKGTDPWFPHTVEEMVIWTVEREIDRKYEEVYQQFLGTRRPYTRTTKPVEVVHSSTLQPVNVSSRPKRPSRAITIIDPSTREPVTQRTQSSASTDLVTQRTQSSASTDLVTQTQSNISARKSSTPASAMNEQHQSTSNLVAHSRKELSPVPPIVTIPVHAPVAPVTDTQSQSVGQPRTPPQSVGQPRTPPRTLNNVPSMEVQSPTLKQDLEAAIKFANSSLPSTTDPEPSQNQPLLTGAQPSALNESLFNAFPSMLTSLFPHEGNPGNDPKFLGLGAGIPATDLTSFFPALSQTNKNVASSNTPMDHPLTVDPRMKVDSNVNHPLNQELKFGISTSNSQMSNLQTKKPSLNQMNTLPTEQQSLNRATQQRERPPGRRVMKAPAGATEARSEDSAPSPRVPTSEPQVVEQKEEEDDGFTQVKSKKLKRFLKKVETPAPTSEVSKPRPRFVSLELDEFDSDLEDETSKGSGTISSQGLSNGLNSNSSSSLSNGLDPQSPEIPIHIRSAMKSISCLVCYKPFSNPQQLKSHCESKSHSTNVLKTIGQRKLPHYPPPHPGSAAKRVCKRRGCRGAPQCVLAHHQKQLSSWQQEWTAILNAKSRSRPQHISQLTTGLLLSQDPGSSQYGGMLVTVSRLCSEIIKPGEETSLEWKITLQGQNWQTLFGVNCHTPHNPRPSLRGPVFTISTISSESSRLGICGPLWEAGSVRSGFLLGKVVLTVTARLSPLTDGATESCELRLNLGYKEFLYFPLSVTASAESSPPQLFTPQHQWDLSHESSSSDELGMLSMDPEAHLQHVPIEDWSGSLTEDNNYFK